MHADEQYAANLAYLHTHPIHAQTFAELGARPLTNIKLLPSPSGALYGEVFDVASQQWVALCHAEDPWGQAERNVDRLYTPHARVFCLVGLGLGYNALCFVKRLQPYQRLSIWDVDGQLFKAMMYAVDIKPLFETPNVNILVGDQVVPHVETWWLQLQAPEKLMIQSPIQEDYTTIYLKTAYQQLIDRTIDMLRFHGVGLSTWRQFGRAIGDNDLENLPEYCALPGYEQLAGLWEGKPAVCVAAGPSLQRNLLQLLDPAIRERVAIITAGTVYALLHGLGLAPEIVTTIDFQRLNWTDQFAQIPLDPEAALVYLHSTYPQTPRRWPGPRFVAENSSDTVNWLRRYTGGKGSAAEVQTVAHLNLKVAMMLGADPIILLGQDLSMPRAHHHAAGARAQDQAPAEAAPEAFLEVPDFQGHPVWTRHSFLSMQTVFARLIAEAQAAGRTVYNCSEAGLALPGAIHAPLASVLAPLHGSPAPAPLRPLLAARAAAYVPVLDPTLYTDLASVRHQVEELETIATEMDAAEAARVALTLTADQQRAMVSAEVENEADTLEAVRSGYDLTILAAERRILQERTVAWATMAVRRFDFLELMAEIPPPPETVAVPQTQWRYNAARLLRVAVMIHEEVPQVRRLLRLAETRLRLLVPPPMQDTDEVPPEIEEAVLPRLVRFLALQLYTPALALLREAEKVLTLQQYMRLYAQIALHRQAYDVAAGLLDAFGFVQRQSHRIRAYLKGWERSTITALPGYLAPVVPMAVSASPIAPHTDVWTLACLLDGLSLDSPIALKEG